LKNLKRLLPVLIGLGLLAWILSRNDLPGVWELLKRTDFAQVFLGFAALLLMIYIKGIRWSFLLKMQGHRYPVWDCFLIYLNSLFWGNVTPGRAGDFIKVLYLREDLKHSTGYAMASVFVDRVFDLYILLVLGALGLLLYPLPGNPNLVKAVEVFFIVLIAVSVLVLNRKVGGGVLRFVFQKMMGEALKARTDKAFSEFHRGMEAYYRPAILLPVLLTFLSYISFFWGCHRMALSLDIDISILYLAFVVSVVNIVSLVTFAGFGTREGAVLFLFGMVSLSNAQALAYSTLLLVVGVLLISLVGFLAYLAKPIRWKKGVPAED
jgi:hypothetical protein